MKDRGIGWAGAIAIFIVGSLALTYAFNPYARHQINESLSGLIEKVQKQIRQISGPPEVDVQKLLDKYKPNYVWSNYIKKYENQKVRLNSVKIVSRYGNQWGTLEEKRADFSYSREDNGLRIKYDDPTNLTKKLTVYWDKQGLPAENIVFKKNHVDYLWKEPEFYENRPTVIFTGISWEVEDRFSKKIRPFNIYLTNVYPYEVSYVDDITGTLIIENNLRIMRVHKVH